MPSRPRTVLCIAGARPNFIKIAPIMRAFAARSDLRAKLVHTGQHYGADMSGSFFAELGIPAPEIDLEVGSASHAVQTAEIMRRFEPVLDASTADAVLVVGDVNSTLACALVAAKRGVPVIHVEAGLRSYDRAMPEEINRVLTDQISDLLFTTESDAAANLAREGISGERVRFVGNVMIDTLFHCLDRALPLEAIVGPEGAERVSGGYGLLTLHRPSNVDDPEVLAPLLEALVDISVQLPLVFPVHPRTSSALRAHGLDRVLAGARILALPPLSYLGVIGLLRRARLVLTDSGGLQEESTALGIPCLTLRPNTERPVTVELGSNIVVGNDPARVHVAFADFQAGRTKAGRVPPLWDGKAADRIVDGIAAWFAARP